MKAEYINPFLDAARMVLEQLIFVKPATGNLSLKNVVFESDSVWIRIGMIGQIKGDVMFSLKRDVALKIVSAMMGGYPIADLDEMGQSTISELGNMISGNASTILFNQGVVVDITPPKLIMSAADVGKVASRALTIPLIMENIGELDIQVMVG